ncbi:aldehyde dehydrogenase family protein [Mameliella alba]|nr:aldehyde dehydrogenase family protein [Mameliella alba]MBY6167935.1 aldehyde dehydrogenase family protein [Mameliella alba]MBY6172956.1 aldehyde dehydrogenase family protein [Mameliella alba]
MTRKFEDLTTATGVLLERELEAHRRNLSESAQIAGELAQIDAMRQAAQADQGAINARQILGADTLWQGWLVSKRAEILRRSAMARAREADSLARARTAFSRAEAAKSLAQADKDAARKRRLQSEAETIEMLGVLREGRSRGYD